MSEPISAADLAAAQALLARHAAGERTREKLDAEAMLAATAAFRAVAGPAVEQLRAAGADLRAAITAAGPDVPACLDAIDDRLRDLAWLDRLCATMDDNARL